MSVLSTFCGEMVTGIERTWKEGCATGAEMRHQGVFGRC